MIRTPFDAASTAAEVAQGVDLTGRRALVTGANSGIGAGTARVLALAGADVTLAVRNLAEGRVVASRIAAECGAPVGVLALDLSDLGSVRACVAAWSGPLHILVNNAGIMAVPRRELTRAGHELQFATNHLGHFALSVGLHSALARAGDARVVSVSSAASLISPVVFDDVHFDFRPYDPWLAYGQSKTANILFAVGAARRWATDGIAVNALMPGSIATNLRRHVGQGSVSPLGGARRPPRKTIEQGASTSVLLAASPLLEGISGHYFEDCQEAETIGSADGWARGVAPYALDPHNSERLWTRSEELVSDDA